MRSRALLALLIISLVSIPVECLAADSWGDAAVQTYPPGLCVNAKVESSSVAANHDAQVVYKTDAAPTTRPRITVS
jgi:hypothetical protein